MPQSPFETGAWMTRVTLRPERSFPLGRPSLRYPRLVDGDQLVVEEGGPEGRPVYRDITERAGSSEAGDREVVVLIVRRSRASEPLGLYLTGVVRDGNQDRWDVVLEPVVRIVDGLTLLKAGVAAGVRENHPLTDERLQDWLQGRVIAGLADRLGGRTHEVLADPVRTPLPQWEAWLREVLQGMGLDATLSAVPVWVSADAELRRREAEARRRAQAAEEARQLREEEERRLREAQADQEEFERIARAERSEEEHRAAKQDLHRGAELAQLDLRHETDRLKLQREVDLAREQVRATTRAAEIAEEEHRNALLRCEARRLELLSGLAKQREKLALDEIRTATELVRAREEADRDLRTGPAHRDELSAIARQTELVKAQTALVEAQNQLAAAKEGGDEARRRRELAEAEHRRKMEEIQRHDEARAARIPEAEASSPGKDRKAVSDRILEKMKSGKYVLGDLWLEAESEGVHDEVFARWTTADWARKHQDRKTVQFTESMVEAAGKHAVSFTLFRVGARVGGVSTRNLVGPRETPGPQGPGSGAFRAAIVRVGDENRLRMGCPRDGYVTLINPGTGGQFFLVAPNDRAPSVYARAGDTLEIPGRLLPGGLPRQLGPEGVEAVVALVTDHPLIREADLTQPDRPGGLMRWDPESGGDYAPFRVIGDAWMDALQDYLKQLPPHSWAVSVRKWVVLA